MFFLILKKNSLKKNSYNLMLYNSNKQIRRKIGVVSYNSGLRKFVLVVDLFLLCELFKIGVYLNLDFYKCLYKIVNNFKL